MSMMDRTSLLRRTATMSLLALPDNQEDYSTRGAQIIFEAERFADQTSRIRQRGTGAVTSKAVASQAAATVRPNGTAAVAEAGEAVAEHSMLKTAASTGMKAAGFALKWGVKLDPYMWAATGAELAYDTWKFGFRAVTGKAFETTSVGKAVTRTSDAVWHAPFAVAGGAMDLLGMHQAASFTRGTAAEFVTGSRVGESSVPPDPATPGTTSNSPRPTLTPGPTRETGFTNWDETKKPARADRPATPRSTQSGRTFAMGAGPERTMTAADWAETPYQRMGEAVGPTTRPLPRAMAVMDMRQADLGIAMIPEASLASTRLTPGPERAPAPNRTAQRSGAGID
jgi:hypothetical protein